LPTNEACKNQRVTPERWRQLEHVFGLTVEAEPAQRPSLLDSLCGDDAELRRGVEELLAADTLSDAPIQSALASAAADMTAAQAVRRIGPYEIVRELGRGGMGVVYLGVRDDDEYRKQVAVKVLPSGLESNEAIERFRRERQILAGLEHPNIARLLDGGSTAERLPYLVMEYVDGRPLLADAAARGLSIRQRIELFLPILDAVAHAHRQLVVHRDLKPGNLLVNGDGEPRLLDFGVAKLLQGNGVENATKTQAFTPDYASPEQVRGEPTTTATDVYALGAVLYELLSGEQAQPVGSDLRSAIQVVCERNPSPPSTVAPAAVSRALRGDLDTIVLKAMHKEPARRYASVAMLAEDLQRHLAGLPVAARPDTLWYRASKLIGRNRLAFAVGVLVLVSLSVALSVSVRAGRRAERRYQEMRMLAGDTLFEIHDQTVKLPGSVAARALIVKRAEEYLEKLSREETSDPHLLMDQAAALLRLGDAQGGGLSPSLGRAKDALASYERAYALLDRLPPSGDSPRARELRAELDTAIGHVLVGAGRLDEASRRLDRASAVVRSLGRTADPYRAARISISKEYLARFGGDNQARFAAAQSTLAAAEALARDAPESAETYYWLAIAHVEMSRGDGSTSDPKRWLREDQAAAREIDQALALAPNDVRFLREKGVINLNLSDKLLEVLDDRDQARAAIDNAVAVLSRLHEADPNDNRTAYELAFSLAHAGDIDPDSRPAEALALYDRAVAVAFDPGAALYQAVERPFAMVRASRPLLRLGRVDEARARARAGVAALRAALPQKDGGGSFMLVTLARSLRLLAEAELAAKDDPAALRTAEEAVAIADKAKTAEGADLDMILTLVDAEATLGDVHRARAAHADAAARTKALDAAGTAYRRAVAMLDGWHAASEPATFIAPRKHLAKALDELRLAK
jgi:serine/threonine protein kinase